MLERSISAWLVVVCRWNMLQKVAAERANHFHLCLIIRNTRLVCFPNCIQIVGGDSYLTAAYSMPFTCVLLSLSVQATLGWEVEIHTCWDISELTANVCLLVAPWMSAPIHLVDVEIFHWIRVNCDLLVVLDEYIQELWRHIAKKVIRIHPLETMTVFLAIVVEIFQSGHWHCLRGTRYSE